jgi:LysM repeat protein
MKILKIFGIVVGIHLFALILIFANPGCSSTSKPAPQPSDTVAKSDPAPSITVPTMASPAAQPASDTGLISPVANGFNPDAPATYAASAPSSGVGVRFTPTRPNTPAASAVLTTPVENVTPATTYTVKGGDSLWTLQKKFHIPLKEIAAANNIKASTPLHEGQKLVIPSRAVTTPAATTAGAGSKALSGSTNATAALPTGAGAAAEPKNASTRPTNEEFKYVVKPGETLGMIARKFDVRTRDLAVHNAISDPKNLRAGMELSIPGWQPTGSSGKASKGSSSGRASKSTASTPAPAPAQPAEVPNILDSGPSPSSPEAAPTTSVPVINIDETPTTTPAPKS